MKLSEVKRMSWERTDLSDAERLEHLVAELRSDEPINRRLRDALAEAFDPQGKSEFKFSISRRRRGRPGGQHGNSPTGSKMTIAKAKRLFSDRSYEIARAVGERVILDKGADGSVEAAVAAVADEYGLSRSTIFSYWSQWCEGLRVFR